jgi:hypothetical protein
LLLPKQPLKLQCFKGPFSHAFNVNFNVKNRDYDSGTYNKIVIYATSELSNTFFYEKENLPLERSQCAIRRVKKRYFTNEMHTKFFWRP